MPDLIDINAVFLEHLGEIERLVLAAREQSTNHDHDSDLRSYYRARADKLSELLKRLRAAHERGLLL